MRNKGNTCEHGGVKCCCSQLLLKEGWESDLTDDCTCSYHLGDLLWMTSIHSPDRSNTHHPILLQILTQDYISPVEPIQGKSVFPSYFLSAAAWWMQITHEALASSWFVSFFWLSRKRTTVSRQLWFGHITDYSTILAKSDLCLLFCSLLWEAVQVS